MEIKCFNHPLNNAKFVCAECGFLCEQDEQLEDKNSHALAKIDSKTKDLYRAMAQKINNTAQMDALSTIQAQLNQYIVYEESVCKVAKEEANFLLGKASAAKFLIEMPLLIEHINKAVYNDGNSLIEKYTEKLKEKILQIIEIGKKLMKPCLNKINTIKQSEISNLELIDINKCSEAISNNVIPESIINSGELSKEVEKLGIKITQKYRIKGLLMQTCHTYQKS